MSESVARPMPGLVLSTEHASFALPPEQDIGVSEAQRRSQAGWDHGALEIAADLGARLGVRVHAGTYTRMWIDLNRAADHPDVIPQVSYGAPVPGNAKLTPADRAARIATYHAPYWSAVRENITAVLAAQGGCVHLSSHSFDPSLDPVARTYDLGVLFDVDHPYEAPLAEQLIAQLTRCGFDVRKNQPYGGTSPLICTTLRGELAGRAYAGITLETSHAITHTRGGCARVAAAVLPFLRAHVAST